MEHGLINVVLFSSFFLILTSLLQRFTKRFSLLPYTVALLITGMIAQFVVHYFHLNVHLEMSADMIYFVLLPILLFESAFHINFHQFRLQFKTITFVATFGLLLSIFTIGFLLARLVNLPFEVALMFGALISATDPIAVIALFKTLGAPKRLGLVADGESMLNDATGVIAFRVISGFVLSSSGFATKDLWSSLGNFTYVFLGSMILGAILGYLFSKLIEKIQNDRVVETTLTLALALGSFAGAEHFFHLSGVITTVIAAITVGNLGKTKISANVIGFIEELWEYFGFIALSLVFFFATFNLDFTIFTKNPLNIGLAILTVLIGRAVSVYVSMFLTNNLPFFKDEPNVPMKWQHILNWGGLRGVIPLVLVYSLPRDFRYYNEMLAYTLGAFLFTLFVNGLTIRTLLLKLGLHLPKREEEIIHDEMTIFELEEAKETISKLKQQDFDPDILNLVSTEINEEEQKHKEHLLKTANAEELMMSLRLHGIAIERNTLEQLYNQGYINENVYFDFEAELDIQQDALEYPEVYKSRATTDGGLVDSRRSYRKRIAQLRGAFKNVPFLKNILKQSEQEAIRERIGLLKARIITSEMVIEYLQKLDKCMGKKDIFTQAINTLRSEHEVFIDKNKKEFTQLSAQHPKLLKEYQKSLAYSFIVQKSVKSGH